MLRTAVNRLRLTPPLPWSVGLGTVFFPAQRHLVQRAVEVYPVKVQANQLVVVLQSHVPKAGKYAGLDPLLEAAVHRAGRANARRALVGTLGVVTATLATLYTNWLVIGVIVALTIVAYLVPLLRGKMLHQVIVGQETLTLEFATFGRPFRRAEQRTTVSGVYKTKVGPKGITLRALKTTDTAANEIMAGVQPDLTR